MNTGNNIFNDVKKDTVTTYNSNGDIDIKTYSFDDKKVSDSNMQFRGRVCVDMDGTAHIKRYNDGNGQTYPVIYSTKNGSVRSTGKSLIIKFKLPVSVGRNIISQLFNEESSQVASWLNSRKEDTTWSN